MVTSLLPSQAAPRSQTCTTSTPTNVSNQTRPQLPTGKGLVWGHAPQKHHQSSAVIQRSREAPKWSQGQDIAAQPGFAWRCLAEGPAALAPVGSAASLGAVWLNGRAVQLRSCCSKHSQRGRWFGLVEESTCCAVEACWVMLPRHWLSLWDGNFGSGSDGEARDSSRLGREKECASGLC